MYRNDNAQMAAAPRADADQDTLARLYIGRALRQDEANALFTRLVRGELSEPVIAAMLVALRVRGETADELIGAAQALRAADVPFARPDYLFADTCGTGGDEAGTINVSTAVAFVAAAAGLPIAKHGNRSFTSKCGSADVLEHLGVKLAVSPVVARQVLDETGVCFLFAPHYHPGLRHAGPVRRALGVRTIMNVLGPCLNPAEPPVQLLGVAEERLLEPVARTLLALGTRQALVVHGSGVDEIALHGPTTAIRIEDGAFERLTLTPREAGLDPFALAPLRGGGPAENAARLQALLSGRGGDAETSAVAFNAGALLMIAGLAAGLREGVGLALDTLRSGAPARTLKQFAEATHA